MILLGLILLLGAVVVGVAGVLSNAGSADGLSGGFDIFGYSFTGTESDLFLAGICVGAIGLLGLGLLFSGSRSSARKARTAKRELKRSRRETVAAQQDRDNALRDQQRAAVPAQAMPAQAMPAQAMPAQGVPNNDPRLAPNTAAPAGVVQRKQTGGHFWNRWSANRRAGQVGTGRR